MQQQAGDWANETMARDGLGQAYHNLGYHQAAVDQYEHGLRLARALADPILEAQLTIHLGDTYEAVGDSSSAQERWEMAHKMLMNAGHPQASDVARKLHVDRTRTSS